MTFKKIIKNIKEIRETLPEIGDPPDEWLEALDKNIEFLEYCLGTKIEIKDDKQKGLMERYNDRYREYVYR